MLVPSSSMDHIYDPKLDVLSSPKVANGLVTHFNNMPDMEKHNNEMDMGNYVLQEQIAELQEKLLKRQAKAGDD
ncbi:hypothetical protein FRX31_008788 [Thalictrum thalictroides]|uniref:Uncharacterized protein n=1 Tax=Thalictrum thalictroides TaxID=46969 RepID=A0A7J6WX49_THATH|nr:hypothetical protein FRX31_008788 [Thalictrum thalictroides]